MIMFQPFIFRGFYGVQHVRTKHNIAADKHMWNNINDQLKVGVKR